MDLGRRVLFIVRGSGAAGGDARRPTGRRARPPRRPPRGALRAARALIVGAVSLGAGRRCCGAPAGVASGGRPGRRGRRTPVAGALRAPKTAAHTAYIPYRTRYTVRTARKSAPHCAVWASRGCHTDTLPRYRYALL